MRPGDFMMMVIFTFRGPAFGMAQQFGATPILVDYDADDMIRFCELSLRYRPTGLYNLSSVIVLAMADACERGGYDPTDVFSSYRALVQAGEPLSGKARAVVESWGAPMFEHTNVGDVGTAFQCPRARRSALLGRRHARREPRSVGDRARRRPTSGASSSRPRSSTARRR